MDYKQAGVDVEAGRDFVHRIKSLVGRTHRSGVLGGIGGFNGLFELPGGYRQPVLVSGTDGVGTKLKIAQECRLHNSIGIDLVAMCVNDVVTSGAEPLFFLDYLATGKLDPDQLTEVVGGITEGCIQAGCALLGGETAEMPGFYTGEEYDLAGFCVGIVEKDQIIHPDRVKLGDRVLGLGSSGFHSNGFSLIRKVVKESEFNWPDRVEALGVGKTLGEWCLTPTQIYVQVILAALRSGMEIHGLAHITGGGIPENLPRCLQPDQSVAIDRWDMPPIFSWLAGVGDIPQNVMFDTFNMGIGMIVIVPPTAAEQCYQWFGNQNVKCYDLGEVIKGNGTIGDL